MKRALVLLGVLFLMAVPVMAQDAEGPSLDPTTMEAILVLVGGVIVTTLAGLVKKLLKATGNLAILVAGVVAVAATGAYFLFINPPFDLAKFLLYAVAVFGEATGWFHFYKKATA